MPRRLLLAFVTLCSCAEAPPPATPVPERLPMVIEHPIVTYTPENGPPPELPKYQALRGGYTMSPAPFVVHEDPAACEDSRIKVVLAKCTQHGRRPYHVWFTCPKDLPYSTKRFADIEMNHLIERCNLPVDPGETVVHAEVHDNIWTDQPEQGRDIIITK